MEQEVDVTEVVELMGGPMDGKRMAVRHGNIIRMTRLVGVPLLGPVDAPLAPMPIEDIEYVRSAKNPRRFIFVPTARDGLADRRHPTPGSKL